MMFEYLLIFISSVIFSLFWEWTKDKHKRIWYLYVGIWIIIAIMVVLPAIFNPQSLEREAIVSWEGISLIISSGVGWSVGEKIYHYKS